MDLVFYTGVWATLFLSRPAARCFPAAVKRSSGPAGGGRGAAMAAVGRLLGSWVLLAPLLGGLALLGVGPVPARALHNVTAELFGAEAWGTLAAFGDLNSDKQTDLFVLRESQCLPGPPSVRVPLPVFPTPLARIPGPPAFPGPSLPALSPFISSILAACLFFPIFSKPRSWPDPSTV